MRHHSRAFIPLVVMISFLLSSCNTHKGEPTPLWTLELDYGIIHSALETDDGHYIISGTQVDSISGEGGPFIASLTSSGTLERTDYLDVRSPNAFEASLRSQTGNIELAGGGYENLLLATSNQEGVILRSQIIAIPEADVIIGGISEDSSGALFVAYGYIVPILGSSDRKGLLVGYTPDLSEVWVYFTEGPCDTRILQVVPAEGGAMQATQGTVCSQSTSQQATLSLLTFSKSQVPEVIYRRDNFRPIATHGLDSSAIRILGFGAGGVATVLSLTSGGTEVSSTHYSEFDGLSLSQFWPDSRRSYMVIGGSHDEYGESAARFAHLSQDGTVHWQSTLNLNEPYSTQWAIPTTDGNFLITGHLLNSTHGMVTKVKILKGKDVEVTQ